MAVTQRERPTLERLMDPSGTVVPPVAAPLGPQRRPQVTLGGVIA